MKGQHVQLSDSRLIGEQMARCGFGSGHRASGGGGYAALTADLIVHFNKVPLHMSDLEFPNLAHHGPGLWALLGQVMPNDEDRRAKLAQVAPTPWFGSQASELRVHAGPDREK
ncbi:M48 family metallopeptidase [Antrihabitans cavernicola]|uniref:M48 family metallopeptidase n=1 Tax=Antrihabitans cavernicola TaxID=2495913 RepID=A0A5A7SES2_9NOCA|nr:M48 family metallopeptidase [Spelaeibacter cavernicola]KAA0024084.1 M48 family metallopeptidase [Spelaeibacter cavernicola]